MITSLVALLIFCVYWIWVTSATLDETPAECFTIKQQKYSAKVNYWVINDYDVSCWWTDVIIPESISWYKIEWIYDYAFYNKWITSVVIPDTVVNIWIQSFAENNIDNVVLWNSVSIIWQGAFSWNSIVSLVVPWSVSIISDGAFQNNLLKTVVLQDWVGMIGINAFKNNQIGYAYLPSSISKIGEWSFDENENMVVVVEDVKSFVDDWFSLWFEIIERQKDYFVFFDSSNNFVQLNSGDALWKLDATVLPKLWDISSFNTWDIFVWWFLNKQWVWDDILYDFTVPVTGDLILYPHWIEPSDDSFLVSFSEYWNIVQIQTVWYWKVATNVWYSHDRWTWYVWKWWYSSLWEWPFDFSSAIFENTYLYAVWWCDEHYHMSWNQCELDTYTITWLDEDGTLIDTTSVEYWSMPVHEDVMKKTDLQYSYEFSGWTPSLDIITWDAEYTAIYSRKLNEYTVTIQSNNIDYGLVSVDSITAGYWSDISFDEDVLMIWNQNVTATVNESTDIYSYLFVWWTDECGAKLTWDCTITANFIPVKNQYLVQFVNYDGTVLQSGMYTYGDMPVYTWETPQKDGWDNFEYRFDWWSPMISEVNTWNEYIALFSDKICLSWYHLEQWECVDDIKIVSCEEFWAPDNSTYDVHDVEILWDWNAWPVAQSCSWTCNEQYHQDGNTCELDSEDLSDDIVKDNPLRLDENLQKDVNVDNIKADELNNLNEDILLSENDDSVDKGLLEEINIDQDLEELEQRKVQWVSQIREAKNIKRGAWLLMNNSITLQSPDPSRVLDTTKGSVNLTFNANWWGFIGGNTTEIVEYGYYNREEIKYSHTSNYTDGNSDTTTYITTSDSKTETVTITGAQTLSVNVIYDLGHSDGILWFIGTWTDVLTIYRWNWTTSQVEQLRWDSVGTKNYSIQSDSVTFKMDVWSPTLWWRTAEEKWYYATISWIVPVGWRTEVSELENPNREWYRFLGWTRDLSWEVEFDFDTTEVTWDIVLYAQWEEAETVIVSFDTNWWTNISSQFVVSGETAIQPEDPTKNLYNFGGWYLDSWLMMEFDFSTIITSDITLYAKWDSTYQVTFNTAWWNNISPQYISSWKTVTKPADPVLQWKIFNYWSVDSWWNSEYDFSTPVTSDMVLYAQWSNICTVSFRNGYCYYGNNNNRRALCTYDINTTSVQVACGKPVRRPVDPNSPITVQNRSVYFAKWSTREQPWYGNTSYDYNFNAPVNNNITLYAIWSTNYYTIWFDANGWLLYGMSSLEYNENKIWQYGKVREPDEPIRTWYTFTWWSTTRNNWSEFDFNTQITEDMTFYAQWLPITYTIKYDANGWSWVMNDTNMVYDTAQNLRVNEFTKANATFDGWNTKRNGLWTWYTGGQSVNNLTEISWTVITLYAQWSCNSWYVQNWNECEMASCTFLWQTINNGSSMVVYSGGSATCPDECTQWLVTCTNWVLWWDTGYTNLNCTTNGVSCSDSLYPLTSCPAHWVCNSSCTSYTVSDNACVLWITRYRLDSCDEHYHQSGNICVINTYTVIYNVSWWHQIPSQEITYGSMLTLPWATMSGYQFSWWYTSWWIFIGLSWSSFLYNVEDDLVLYARWLAKTDVNYTVRHWLQNANDDLYTELVADRQILQWTSDTLTQAIPNNYTWFKTGTVTQSIISWDESTIVDIYYDRQIYTITIDLNWWIWVSELTWKYWQILTVPNISKSWYTLKKFIPEFPTTMPLNGASVRTVWTLTNWWVSISIVQISWTDFNFWSVVSSNRVQILTWYLWENTFQLEDSRWENTGYYVTLSISSLNSVHTSNTISSSNIQLKSHWITTISWTPATDVGIASQMTWRTTMNNTVLYLSRPDISVDDDPLVWRYWDNLQFKVTVPPYTYSDNYKGVITYTLYDNE